MAQQEMVTINAELRDVKKKESDAGSEGEGKYTCSYIW